ncbi:MAG: glycosyltransferase [Winogradskyella sp.]|uniref:glycosyltransferase n=1 Tax=Winogradskyella sp. TaxID=1883156 RepID=UPI0025EF7834|nr:glycosyltransferase [Winogradskyella sp.]NRB60101.1 glycosyltransferase [Winogradskyella sp.]
MNHNNKIKIVICCKDLESRGGVANFYRVLSSNWNYPQINLKFHEVGSPHKVYNVRKKRYFGYILDSFKQIVRFYGFLKKEKPDKVIVNPSLIPIPIIRDGIYLLIAKKLNIKVITFIRGWRENFLSSKWIYRMYFLKIFKHSGNFIVLANSFKDELQKYFPEKPIEVMYTTYDDREILPRNTKTESKIKMVYISRVSKEKGFFVLLNVMKELINKGIHNLVLNVFGHFVDQNMEREVSVFLNENPNVKQIINFHGFVDGTKKYQALADSHLFVLPSYKEGCPNSVIEATAAGCFVIATNVGAIPEIVKDGFNSIIIKPKNNRELESAITKFCENKNTYLQNCSSNREKAKQKFDILAINKKIAEITTRDL